MIARMIEPSYNPSESTFTDVNKNNWAYEEITALAQLGILRGYSDNTFRPEANVKRDETAAIIERAREVSDS